MPAPSRCPDPQQLQQLLLGRLDEGIAVCLEQHVEHCDDCGRLLPILQANDTLVDTMRAWTAVVLPAPDQKAIGKLLPRLHELRCLIPESTSPSGTEKASRRGDNRDVLALLSPPQAPDEIGRLGPYRVLELLGRGGMGVVFRVEDPQLQRTVALKVMLPEVASKASARERFLLEARAAAKIEHDHIVTIFQVGEDRGVPFLVMQLLKGMSLEDLLKKRPADKPFSVDQVLKVGREIAEGLAAAHEHGLIHRDIKPANIWLDATAGGRVKILDFGLAQTADGDPQAPGIGAIIGTAAYMAPEQAWNDQVDGRADLFSLGCVLYRLCTGRLPFKGSGVTATLVSVAREQPPPVQDLNPHLPPRLAALIMKLLAKMPADRPESARMVADELQALARQQPPARAQRAVAPNSPHAIAPMPSDSGQAAASEGAPPKVKEEAATPALDPPLIPRERAIVQSLAKMLADRSSAQVDTEVDFQARNAAARAAHQEDRQRIVSGYEAEKAAVEKELIEARQSAALQFESQQAATQKEFADTRHAIAMRFDADNVKAEKAAAEAAWTLSTVYEAKRREVEAPFQEVNNKVAEGLLRIQAIRQEARQTILGWHHRGRFLDWQPTARPGGPPVDSLRETKRALVSAETRLEQLKSLRMASFFAGRRPLALFLALWGTLSAAFFGLAHFEVVTPRFHFLLVALGASVLLELALGGLIYALGHLHVVQVFRALAQDLANSEDATARAKLFASETLRVRLIELAKDEEGRDAKLRQTKEKYRILMAGREQLRDTELRQAEEKYPRLLAAQAQQRDARLAQAEETRRRRLAENKQRAEAEARQADEKYRRAMADSKELHDKGWHALARSWQKGLGQVQAAVAIIDRESRRMCPPWDDPSWLQWSPPRRTPVMLRFGQFRVDREMLTPDVGAEARAQLPEMPAFMLPALMPFPQRCSMLLRARDEGRAAAVQTLQAMMLRFLTSLPPGKARFTIVDPVGLGENFAAFMHLADHDEALVGSRIWTEPHHIEQRLADLAAHMENVIQKYLRNQYASIEEYNAQAGEVAEAFRVLVVANFPTNFSEEAARRLLSIAASGASCGVYVLLSADTRQSMPDGFHIADLEQVSNTLAWQEGAFVWKDQDFGKFPLQLDTPPGPELLNRLLNAIGAGAKDANRVEVSFDFIAPPVVEYWSKDSRSGIDVALGRAGATKRQHLRLGHGTAQHVLIAGKTGSGKSTLLHALITNLALCYSPDELELYLVDFKKGVEFKTYANHALPHARVIAVESEREFGLSVLQRLDAELRERGERFRSQGVHDLKGYRDASGKACPRIMLIVDEFQEFFTEDDKLAQEAALLLDRLVRQGRAFGLHVLLGSQTLGGAYTLARSTIDQMAVRIALQCSEADANLILSKDNSAARLLSRPGEAIYNDQNGLLEGNDIFQVVWLPDPRREELLRHAYALAARTALTLPRPQLIFEGNAPADVQKNPLLARALATATWPSSVPAATAWLGEAIAIKDPTSAVFRRQTSCNLLLLGQHDEAALGILATALVSLAAQHAPAKDTPASGRFFIADGTPADSSLAGVLRQAAASLPHDVQVGSWRELPAILTEVAEEVDRRQKASEGEFPATYLFLNGLQRFRDLRKQDDDYGFSRRDEDAPASPAKQFETILKEGPAVGVHCLVWCDSLNNLNRSLDRQALREFEMRVLFQMSPNDSSTLIDSPAASKLGMNRALFHSEDHAQPEKFRPYALPSPEWLVEVKRRLQEKVGPTSPAADR